MKTWCIQFEREFEGIDVIHVKQEEKPTFVDAVFLIQNKGFEFHDGYDKIKKIFEV